MTADLDRLIDEIVRKVQDKLLAQGLRLPKSDIKKEIGQDIGKALSAADNSTTPSPTSPTTQALAAMIDHTLLKPDAMESDLKKLCDEARKYKFATVCVNSAFVAKAAELLKGSGVKPIAVVGFPLGAATTSSKAFEAREAIKDGAQEIDMVINVGEMKSKNYSFVLEDIRAVVEISRPIPVKVILETALLDNEQKVIACALSKAGGAAFVKTSTGFGPGGATAEDIALMRRVVGSTMGVKASGGIRTLDDAERMIRAGASRLGASASVAIVEEAAGKRPAGVEQAGDNTDKQSRKKFSGLPYKAAGSTNGTGKGPSNGKGGGSY